ncbi:TrbG/VirB9 family P-type conjugative transfer protein [Burkholderia multivorans]|uniref:TrbG/VirB9 family P-type conjugative transfer protein n=1 Tax=Burkholderia multivorans TaxID=87883 RepID=UPI000CFF96FB|nr:TrbG/VirB9 family P-type conjugative transfer protein [Burkholderia multivorans]MCL4626064.1 TrbG/VirB9 family P-type conjugative transfer protein [Burkholderia multivorans]PRG84618.1 type IV secretion system protein VirB9 [Burkholderia multivorans]
MNPNPVWRVLQWSIACGAVALTSMSALATQVPGYRGDSRVRQVLYDENEVVQVTTQRGAGTQIVLGAGEHIERVGMGDSGEVEGCGRAPSADRADAPEPDWKISACKGDSVIFLKPGSRAHNTNLIVHTDRHDYAFDLVVLPSTLTGSEDAMYRVTFSYREELAAHDAARTEGHLIAQREAVPAARRNLAYTRQAVPGSDDIVPSAMWDDGRFTYVEIPGNRKIPSVFRVAEDGSEHVPDKHMEGDRIVLHEVARRWVLRLGNEAVELWNNAYDLNGVPPVDGTTVPGVARTLKVPGSQAGQAAQGGRDE